jgi:hypothetical protein
MELRRTAAIVPLHAERTATTVALVSTPLPER